MTRKSVALRASSLLLLLAFTSLAKSSESTWIRDEGDCLHFNPAPVPKESVLWSGSCTDGYADGIGVLKWFVDGVLFSTYKGPLKQGKQSGQASVDWPNGNRYEGQFLDDHQTGMGVFTWADGARYTGSFVDGKRSGTGEMAYPSGTVYQGSVVNNELTGQGQIKWINGNRYVGEFVAGAPSGKGVLTTSTGERYEGDWVNWLRTGLGFAVFANGDRYEGSFQSDQISGPGSMTWVHGDKYVGEFLAGRPSGAGLYQFADGRKFHGRFLEGAPSGPGVATTANGSRFEGEFREGIPRARGGYYSLADAAASTASVGHDAQQSLSFGPAIQARHLEPPIPTGKCDKVERPYLRAVNWSGSALYKAIAKVQDGKISELQIVALRHPGNEPVNWYLSQAIRTAIADHYVCTGTFTLQQEFQIDVK